MFAYVEANGLQLPPQYAERLDSLECLVCPAQMTPARLAYLRREHPQAAQVAVVGMRAALEAVSVETGKLTILIYGGTNNRDDGFRQALADIPSGACSKIEAAERGGCDRARILAFHEAGHAVAAERNAIRVRDVDVRSDRFGVCNVDGTDQATLPGFLAFTIAGEVACANGLSRSRGPHADYG